MFDLFAPLIIGFVGSLHCLGMCGPLVMAYSLHVGKPGDLRPTEAPSLWLNGLAHHLSFHLGRLFTYGLLGTLAASSCPSRQLQPIFCGAALQLNPHGRDLDDPAGSGAFKGPPPTLFHDRFIDDHRVFYCP